MEDNDSGKYKSIIIGRLKNEVLANTIKREWIYTAKTS